MTVTIPTMRSRGILVGINSFLNEIVKKYANVYKENDFGIFTN